MVLIFMVLPIWAELIVVPPWHAGWPSQLLPILALLAVSTAPAFALPALLLALLIRLIRCRAGMGGWTGRALALDAGLSLGACLCGTVVTEHFALLLHQVPLAPVLFRPAQGEAGTSLTALAWTGSTMGAGLALGVLCARATGYTWPEVSLTRRLRRTGARAGLVAVAVYLVIALCDIFLGTSGPLIVALSLLLAMTWLAWRAWCVRRRYTQLATLSATVEARDAYTGDHLASVAHRTAAVAAALGLPAAVVEDYARSALLHDLGKLAVPLRVLTKLGKLDPDELAEMRTHTTVGRTLLQAIPGLDTAAAIAGHHHERWDGAGYRDGLAATAIPLAARIVTVVDAVDAMTTDRPYHRAVSGDEALAEVHRHSGAQFDPLVVAAFARVVEGPHRPPLWQHFGLGGD